jgi:hypothetical protein
VRTLVLLLFVLAGSGGAASCDPVHDDAVTALGGEAPGVRKGPLHRPGQPCILCHDGAIGDPPAFSVAGTIFQTATGLEAADGATITLTSSDGSTHATTANAAGNFYVLPTEYAPVYPMKVAVTYGQVTVKMTSDVGRDGSCATCHLDPAGPGSAGHVFIPPDGVAP